MDSNRQGSPQPKKPVSLPKGGSSGEAPIKGVVPKGLFKPRRPFESNDGSLDKTVAVSRVDEEEYPIKPAAGGRVKREVESAPPRSPTPEMTVPKRPTQEAGSLPKPQKPAPPKVPQQALKKVPVKRTIQRSTDGAYAAPAEMTPEQSAKRVMRTDEDVLARKSVAPQSQERFIEKRSKPVVEETEPEISEYDGTGYPEDEEEVAGESLSPRSAQRMAAEPNLVAMRSRGLASEAVPAPARGKQSPPASLQPVRRPTMSAGGGTPQSARALPMKRPPRIDPAEEALRKKAMPYEWGKTDRFSQDQKKFLERLFKQFAENITTRLAPLLKARVNIEYQNARLRPYSVFIQSLYEPITLITLRMDPETRGLIVIDFPLSFALIDRCLGGPGQPLEEIRYFTEIEVAILERVVVRLIESYQEAWGEVKECKPQYVQMDFNPQTVHIVKPSEVMVCISFEMHMAQTTGPMFVVIPFEYLKGVIPKGSFEEFMLTRTSPPQVGPSVAPLFAKNLDAATVPITVELGSTELSFADLMVLEEGDFIKLDQEITEPLKIKVNDRTKFLGRPGLRDKKLSVQITKVLQEGDEEFDE